MPGAYEVIYRALINGTSSVEEVAELARVASAIRIALAKSSLNVGGLVCRLFIRF